MGPRKNVWVERAGIGGLRRHEFFLALGISQGSYGRRSLLLRRNCLSVSQFEYPSAGCSPAEPACVFPNRLYTPDLETDFKLIEIRREFR